MAGVAEHVCKRELDEMGKPPTPAMVTCGGCGRSWCERCDPAAVSALCHYCHGSGRTSAPIPPRQARRLNGPWGRSQR